MRVADRNPNRFGVRAIIEALGIKSGSAQDLLASMESGETKALLVIGDAWPVEDMDRVAAAIAKLETSVVIQVSDDVVSQNAGISLPMCSFAEQNALMVNGFGRVQRLHAAAQAPHAARPAWQVLAVLAKTAGQALPFSKRSELIKHLSEQVPMFAGLDDDKIGSQGLPRGTDDETRAPRFMGDSEATQIPSAS